MSFKAKFEVDGNEYRVVKCDFSLQRNTDDTGKPASTTRGGGVNIVVESTDDTSLFEWMCDSYMRKDGKITFNKRDEDAKMKEVEIKDAYMISYGEDYDNYEGAMTETISLSARVITVGGGEHENEWV